MHSIFNNLENDIPKLGSVDDWENSYCFVSNIYFDGIS